MRTVREAMRVAVMVVVAVTVGYAVTGRDAAPATRVGSSTLMVGDETARLVERVRYRDPVERVGDVVIGHGQPDSIIVQPDVASAWTVVDEIWPDSRRDDLVQLSVIREGPLGLVGVVHTASGGGWILSIDAADLDRRDIVAETIVHEVAHVVTLSPGRFSFDTGAPCEGVRIDIGCARSDTVLARYAERFWPGGRPIDDGTDAFATAYASTAVHEDLAETFTAWVFDWPFSGPGALTEKITFLQADDELASLRTELVAAAFSL